MDLLGLARTAWRNYAWPLVYAAATAAATTAIQALQAGALPTVHGLEVGAALGFTVAIGSRLNPYAGNHPVIQPHQ